MQHPPCRCAQEDGHGPFYQEQEFWARQRSEDAPGCPEEEEVMPKGIGYPSKSKKKDLPPFMKASKKVAKKKSSKGRKR